MAHSLRIRVATRAFLAALAFMLLWPARGVVPLEPPEAFFTNIADRLLQQQLGMKLNEVQIVPTNRYDSAVHRIFQVTANIYDATTTNSFPAVFRPLFDVRSNGVFLAGFTNDASLSTLPAWLESNPYGIPMVIAARKGFPNFNEFTVRSDITVQRKLQVIRGGSAANGTNQMYVVGISNHVAVESWNSYFRRYPRAAALIVSNLMTLALANTNGIQTNTTRAQGAFTNIAPNTWQGFQTWSYPQTNGFVSVLSTNQVFLNQAVYHFGDNTFGNTSTNEFESTPGFPLPDWQLTISNRLLYVMAEGDRILDLVLLNDTHSIDLHRLLITATDIYGFPAPSVIAAVWDTNRLGGANGLTRGIQQQMQISLGIVPTTNPDWRNFALTLTATENDKNAAIDRFRVFNGFSPFSTNTIQTNNSLTMESPFNPMAKVSFIKTWQANDPLVHSHTSDLRQEPSTNWQYLKPTQTGTNIAPATLGRLNSRYSPWGGRPFSSSYGPWDYDRALRDPGVYGSDFWNLPSSAPLAVEWLGRIHRGTPWQTLFLKADAASADAWFTERGDLRTHPTNDWRLVSLLAALFNTSDVRALVSVNTTNINSWASVFAGLIALTNTNSAPFIFEPPLFGTNLITAGAPQIPAVLQGIERTRSSQRGQYFPGVAAFIAVPELSSASPWLNLEVDQQQWGLTDEAYEILPAQLLGRIRADPVANVFRNGSNVELRFTVFDGYPYRVEGSTNATAWNTVSEPHYSSNGVFTLSVPVAGVLRFFRAVLP